MSYIATSNDNVMKSLKKGWYLMAVVSYLVEVVNANKKLGAIVADTMAIYNSALNYVIGVVEENYDQIKDLDNLERRMFIERLIHNTKSNVAKYDFDKIYYKLPC